MTEVAMLGPEETRSDGNQGRESMGGLDKAFDKKNASVYILYVLLIFSAYVGFGILIFIFGFDVYNTFIDAFYFCIISITAVGYGSSPSLLDDDGAKIFTSFYMLIGLIVMVSILGRMAEKIVENRVKAARANVNSQDDLDDGEEFTEDHAIKGLEMMRWKTKKSLYLQCLIVLIPQIIFFMVSYVLITKDLSDSMGNPWINAFYFSVASITTTGYGDINPETPGAKLFVAVFLPVCVVMLVSMVGKLAAYHADMKLIDAQLKLLKYGLEEEDLKILDTDNDGEVTELEFIEYMLLAMDKVDERTLQELKKQFQALDKDHSGTLDIKDLKKIYTKATLQKTLSSVLIRSGSLKRM